MSRRILTGCLLGFLACGTMAGQAQAPESSEQNIQATLQRAIGAIRDQTGYEQFDYIMTARVRFLVFWAGEDDVGGGYIRRGVSPDNPSSKLYQLVIGSDPAKAPRAINRWGAAWEMFLQGPNDKTSSDSSTFFGFMKVSSGTSVSAMQKELAQEKNGSKFLFSATISEARPGGSFAKVVPFPSAQDFTIHQLDQAEPAVFDRLAVPGEGVLKSVDAKQMQACGRSEGFLSTISDLIDNALAGRPEPPALCYIFNGDRFSLKATQVTRVPQETVDLSLHEEPRKYTRTYHDLISMHFDNDNESTGKPSAFDLLIGTTGKLRGMPVRITYQPNWWFQVVLNVKTPEGPDFAAER